MNDSERPLAPVIPLPIPAKADELPPLDPSLATIARGSAETGTLTTEEKHRQWRAWRDIARLSVVMIGKQCVGTLGSVLPQLAGDVHEIIYLDTGSTDGSPEIAAQCGAKVFHEPWRGSFAAARNAALKHATGRWVLSLDTDEILSRVDIRRLNHVLSTADPAQTAMYVEVEMVNDDGPEGEMNVQVRVFPRIVGAVPMHWHYRVHEQVSDALAKNGVHDWRLSGARLRHVGYKDEGINRAKVSRNREYLLHELEHGGDACDICGDTPRRPDYFLHYHMAKCAAALGLFNDALDFAIKSARSEECRRLGDRAHMQSSYRLWGEILQNSGAPDKAIKVWNDARAAMPEAPVFPVLIGYAHHILGQNAEAKSTLIEAIEMPWTASSSALPAVRLMAGALQMLAKITHDEAFARDVGEDARKTLMFTAESYARQAESVLNQRTVLTQEVK